MIVKEGDTAPNPTSTLTDGSGNPVNLTGASVTARLEKLNETIVFERTAVIDNAVGGIVHYAWQAGDTANPGAYRLEWQVTFSGGAVETFPQRYYLEIIVKENLE